MRIEGGCLVSLGVRMFDAQGNLLEESDAPIVYLHGAGDIFPRVEAALADRQPGDRASITLEPEDAFGEFDAELVHLVEVARLGGQVAAGMRFEGLPDSPDGRTYFVSDVAEGMAVLDANHPLAGRTLRFDVEVVAVELAGPDERVAAEGPEVPDFLRVALRRDH